MLEFIQDYDKWNNFTMKFHENDYLDKVIVDEKQHTYKTTKEQFQLMADTDGDNPVMLMCT